MIGALAFIAMSWILTIFCAWVSDSEPPNTVKSLAKTKVLRPLTVPQPVTTPSPGHLGLLHAEFGRAVFDEHVELLERALVEQQLDALARGQLAAGVLRLDALLAAAELGAGAPLLKGIQDVFHVRCFPPDLSRRSNTAFCRRETPLRPLAARAGRDDISGANGDGAMADSASTRDDRRGIGRVAGAAPAGGTDAVCAA